MRRPRFAFQSAELTEEFRLRPGRRSDQAEEAAFFQVAANHRGEARPAGFAGKIGDGDRDAVGAGAGDLDRQLGLGGRCRKRPARGSRAGCGRVGAWRSIFFHLEDFTLRRVCI